MPTRSVPAFLAIMGLLAGGCGGEPPPNLLLIVVDTLRADHLGAYGHGRRTSPELDAFARDAVRFERAYATAPWTQPSVASILTGLAPATHGADRLLRVLPDSAVTLAERLRDAGYATGAVVSHTLLGPRFGFDQGFETFVHGDALGPGRFSTPGVTERGTQLLEAFAREQRPFFVMLHYFDPHYSYERHPDVGFAAAGGAGRLTGEESIETLLALDPPPAPEEVDFVRSLYDEEVHFTDAGIGRLLRAVDRLGIDERTVVVVSADHGEEFWERGALGHAHTLHEELVRVPLMIRGPGLEPRVVDEPVSLLALAPTLLDLLEVPADGFQARSFAQRARTGTGPLPEPIYLETEYFEPGESPDRASRKHGVIEGNLKLVEDRITGERRLYDLAADPDERDPLPDTRPALEAQLERLAERYASQRLEGAPSPIAPTPAERRMLEALGYVAGAPSNDAP